MTIVSKPRGAAGSRAGLQEKDAKLTSLVEALGNSQAMLSSKEAELQGVRSFLIPEL